MQNVKADIKRFIRNQAGLEIWRPKYFHELIYHLKVKSVYLYLSFYYIWIIH